MEPTTLSWIIVVVTGSAVAKFLGLLMKRRDPGLVAGPVLGVIGAVAAWQGGMLLGLIDPANTVMAGLSAASGGAVLYIAGALFKGR